MGHMGEEGRVFRFFLQSFLGGVVEELFRLMSPEYFLL